MSVNLKEPIVLDGRRWTIFADHEVYYADKSTAGAYVPNELDLIEHIKEKRTSIVTWRNPLPPYDFKTEAYERTPNANTDVIVGDRSPIARDAFRVLINKDRVPATLNFSAQFYVKGSAHSYMRVFLGNDIGVNGVCISGYMRNGQMVSDRIPLEVALDGAGGIKTIKNPVPAICTKIPENGELVTAVVYNSVNDITQIATCNVLLTDMAQATTKPQKQIVDIRLNSPQLSTSNANQLELPVNTPIDDILVTCEVIYTTGSVEKNIDGSKIKLFGFKSSGAYDEMMISSSLGMEIPLQLSYALSADETYIGNDIVDGVINRRYTAITERIDGAYSPKLFVVPVWAGADRGYRLEYYLTDLRRDGIYNATSYVRYAENSPPIDPKLYGIKQRVAVRVNTAEVSPTFKNHWHTETFTITFTAPGTEKRDNFILEYYKGNPAYGDDMYVQFTPFNVTYNKLDITCGKSTLQEWLDAIYYPTYPVFDRKAEGSKPPAPTHFELAIGSRTFRYAITDWHKELTVDTPIEDGNTIRINWIVETATDYLFMGLSPLLMHEKV